MSGPGLTSRLLPNDSKLLNTPTLTIHAYHTLGIELTIAFIGQHTPTVSCITLSFTIYSHSW